MNKSEFHYQMIDLIKKAFPFERVKESVTVRLNGKTFEFDALLISMKTFVEFQGIQHYKHVKFFQKTKRDFVDQKYRDAEKKIYCDREGYGYVELPYDIKQDVQVIKDTILRGIGSR